MADGATDVATKAVDALLPQALGPVCILLGLALAGLFFIYRRDMATAAKAVDAAKDRHLKDVLEANDKVYKALEVVSALTTPKRRGG